jgi:hypothetical protein
MIQLKNVVCAVSLCLSPLALLAQADVSMGPPPVLTIVREFTKPGKGGALHEKTEGAYVAASKAGKAPFHYIGMTSLTGPDRALFFSGYSDLASWEAERKATSPALGAALDKVNVADGDLLSSTDSSVWTMRKDLSLNIPGIQGARYFEIQQFLVKPGHHAEFTELVKLYMSASKGNPDINWVTYEQMFGAEGDAVLAITLHKSMAGIDKEMSGFETAMKSMDKDTIKKLHELEAASIQHQMDNVFVLSPKMSLPPASYITAEPDFWTPKTTAAPVKKTTTP